MICLLNKTYLCTVALAAATLAQSPAPVEFSPSIPSSMPTGLVRTGDGTLEADGRGYRARFERVGATLRTPHATDEHRDVALSVRLADWSRGGVAQLVAPCDAKQRGGEMVCYEHDLITERYGVADGGMEQSFVIAERPAGEGHLVLGISAESATLQAPGVGAAHQALDFVDGYGSAVRYGEAVVFDRGGSPVPIETRYDGAGRIELIVPAEFLDRASYPVTVDPWLFPLFESGATSYEDSNSDIAYDPVNERICMVWERRLSVNDRRIYAAIYDRSGNQLSVTKQITGAGFAYTPTVGYSNSFGINRFVLVWGSSNGLRARMLSPSGWFQGNEHVVSSIPLGTRDRRPAISTSEGRWVVVWDRTSGSTPEPNAIHVVSIQPPSVGSFVFTVGSERLLEYVTSGYVTSPRVPRTHLYTQQPRVRACWERFYTTPAPGDSDVRTAYFTIGPNSIGYFETKTTVPGAGAVGYSECDPDIAMIDAGGADRDYLLVWDDDGRITGQRYDSNGTVGGDITITNAVGSDHWPAVGAGSTQFCVGWLDEDSSGHRPRARGVLTDGTVLPASSALSSAPSSRMRATSVAASSSSNTPDGTFFAWTRENHGIIGKRFDPIWGRLDYFYGPTTCVGPSGLVPQIGVDDPYPGNAGFAVTLTDAPPGSLGVLMVSHHYNWVNLEGTADCILLVDAPLLGSLPAITSSAGQAEFNLPIPNMMAPSAGIYFQWAIHTPGHNALGWITSARYSVRWQD